MEYLNKEINHCTLEIHRNVPLKFTEKKNEMFKDVTLVDGNIMRLYAGKIELIEKGDDGTFQYCCEWRPGDEDYDHILSTEFKQEHLLAINNTEINFNDKETAVLQKIAQKQGVTEFQVLRQALRTYQLIVEGHSKLVEVNPLPKKLVF